MGNWRAIGFGTAVGFADLVADGRGCPGATVAAVELWAVALTNPSPNNVGNMVDDISLVRCLTMNLSPKVLFACCVRGNTSEPGGK